MKVPTTAARIRSWLLMAFLAGVAGVGLFAVLAFSAMEILVQLNASQPAALHSALRANYGMDAQGALFPVLGLGLVEEAIRDQQSGTPVATQYIATIIGGLKTPVPTVTLYFNLTTTPINSTATPTIVAASDTPFAPTPNPTSTPTLTYTPTQTAVLPTLTNTQFATFTATATRVPVKTDVPSDTPTSPVATRVRPSATPVLPTATSVPPSATPKPPKSTPKPPPTHTPGPYPPPVTPVPTIPHPYP